MKERSNRAIIIGLIMAALALPVILLALPADPAMAQSGLNSAIRQDLTTIGSASGLQTSQTLPQMVGSIIKQILTILGIVLVVLIIYAGYLWMTAGGNTDNIDKAKGIIKNATIGLIIMFAAYAITDFILAAVFKGTGIQ